MENVVQISDVDWTIVRPPKLGDGGVPHGYRASLAERPQGWTMKRADLAAFLVDEAEKARYAKRIAGVTSA